MGGGTMHILPLSANDIPVVMPLDTDMWFCVMELIIIL